MMKFLVLFLSVLAFGATAQPTDFDERYLQHFMEIAEALNKGDHKEGSKRINALVKQLKKEKQLEEIPTTYFAMALTMALNNHYRESIMYHKRALRWHKRHMKNRSEEISMNLALTYQLAGKERKARRMFSRAGMVHG